MKHLIVLLAALLLSIRGVSQELNAYNLNMYNGLPENLTYRMIVDKYGYLWICTSKGVVRYNGYESKIFGLDNGLINEDVFDICEDKAGRIWLASMSRNIGYLQNSKYYVASLPEKQTQNLHPIYLIRSSNSIAFANRYIALNRHSFKLFLGENDSFSQYTVATEDGIGQFFVSHLNKYFLLSKSMIFQVQPTRVNGRDTSRIKTSFRIPDSLQYYQMHRRIVFGDYVLCYDEVLPDNRFLAINCITGSFTEINIHDRFGVTGNIEYIYPAIPGFVYVITGGHVLKFDENMNHLSTLEINSLAPLMGSQIKTFFENDFWGSCIGTTTNGIWIKCDGENKFRKKDINLSNYQYKGGIKDSVFFWWNATTHSLATMEKDKRARYSMLSGQNSITNIGLYNKDTFFLQGNNLSFFLKDSKKMIKMPMYLGRGLERAIRDSNTIYAVARWGFFKTNIGGKEVTQNIDLERYKYLDFDSLRNNYWAYDLRSVCIHNKHTNATLKFSDSAIERFGVNHVEKIIFDNRYGNIFLKGYDNISMYNSEKKHARNVLAKYNLKGASMYTYNDLLIVAGRFGVLFSKIIARDSLSAPVFYRNIKDVNYKVVYDCQPAWGKLLLNTDNGVYEVPIPGDSLVRNAATTGDAFSYKFVVNNGDSLMSVKTGDTLGLDQRIASLLFDIINPLGDGKVKYKYRFAGGMWQELNANELVIPASFSPDNYYLVSVIAADNSWKSDRIDLYLYITPTWWQTHNGRRLVWGAAIAGILLLFILSVVTTRRLVLSASRRRSMQMELELKAIYAQINPHFIFNTLNGALLLIRKKRLDEAYEHVSQFSRLLRSYISSSRNKLITIADEIKNLTDYLELQKTRFGNKFQFSILVDETIRAEKVKIPSLLLQPFVENAINHGLLPQNEEGNLKIEFKPGAHKNEIVCIIDDDGIGRGKSKEGKQAGDGKEKSYGDLLINDLVTIFNKYEHMNIEVSYTDKEYPQTGTTVVINIKNPHYD